MLKFRYPDKPIETAPQVVEKLIQSDWICNAKYDGWRLQVYYDGPNQVRCLSRLGRSMATIPGACFDDTFPALFESMSLPVGTVLDCEFIGPRGNQEQSVYIFDMLAWDSEWLINEPYEKRWARCTNLKLPDGPIYLAETHQEEFVAFFDRLKAGWDGNSITLHEGIVIKARNGKLKLARNRSQKSDCMLKLKYREIKAARY